MISIIIPAYNAEKYINKCIDSILNQKYKDYELIIINDFSNDNTIDIITNYSQKNSNVKVISNKENMGPGMTRNIGLNNAKGDYIMFVDSDDYLFPGSLQFIDDMINKYNFDIMEYSYTSKEKTKKKNYEKIYNEKKAFCMFLCYRKMSGYVWGKVIKKSLIGDERFEKLRIGEDGDFMIRMFSKANKVLYSNNEIYYYRIHEDSVSERNIFTEKMLDGVKRLPIIKEKLFKSADLNKYKDLYYVFEFRTLFARIEKMIKTNSVEQYHNDFNSIMNKMKDIQFKVLRKTIKWNIKNVIYIMKFWLICIKYKL